MKKNRLIFGTIAIPVLACSLAWISQRVWDITPKIRAFYSEQFKEANESAQIAFLVFLALSAVFFAVLPWWVRMQSKLKLEKLEAQNKTFESEIKDLKKNDLERKTEFASQNTRIKEATSGKLFVWTQDLRAKPPRFIPTDKRPTRFVSVINLKGGVGKTFLSSNLAATLTRENIWHGKVLVIDLDFQGTLSESTVSETQLSILRRAGLSSASLHSSEPLTSERLLKMAVPMNGVSFIDVIIGHDSIDQMDLASVNKLFLKHEETRFDFRRHFHAEWFFSQYNLVIFDCPPRMTASSVNALACSDYVLIPTRLDSLAINAVPKTMEWMRDLQDASVIVKGHLGIIGNEAVTRDGKLIQNHENAQATLRDMADFLQFGVESVFENPVLSVPQSQVPPHPDHPCAVDDDIRTRCLVPSAKELAERLNRI